MQYIKTYFPNLTPTQERQFAALGDLYTDWNAKINVISRKDIDNLYLHHILHSLGIAKAIEFTDGTTILDVGTGGGFPGIPLAILFPEARFTAVDSIGKKITVVRAVAEGAGIANLEARNCRVEHLDEHFDYAVSRAVTDMATFVKWVWPLLERGQHGSLPNGILYLKGGDLREELQRTRLQWQEYPIPDFFDDPFFETKKVVYTSR